MQHKSGRLPRSYYFLCILFFERIDSLGTSKDPVTAVHPGAKAYVKQCLVAARVSPVCQCLAGITQKESEETDEQ